MVAVARSPRKDVKIIGLMGVAHFFSHFYQLALPPLFVFMKADLGLSYTELGLLTTLFYIASGVFQPIAGILVDRIGARAMLLAGFAVLAAATASCGLFTAYASLLAASALAGAGNSVFHPADYSILSASISESRMGRAFSIHALGGFLGYAAAPVTLFALASVFDWRTALILGGLAGLVAALAMSTQRSELRSGAHRRGTHDAAETSVLGIVLQLPIVMCFLFFVLGAMAQIGSQTFTTTTLHLLYDYPLSVASSALSGFLFGAPAGIVAGGLLADRYRRHDIVAACGVAAACLCFVVVAWLRLPAALLIAVFAAAGLVYGMAMPSRDMIVRSATPEGASGRVFGFVYSGLDVGSALTPVTFGFLLDQGAPRAVFVVIAALFAGAIVTALAAGGAAPRHRGAPLAEPGE